MPASDACLSEEQLRRYSRDGYVAVDGVLDAGELTELRDVTDMFVDRSREVDTNTDVFDLEPGHTAQSPKLRRLKDPYRQHPAYERLLRDERILNMVEQLIGPRIRFQNTKLNMKSPEFGSPVKWHQDWAFYPHTNDDLLAVGIAIDDMLLENGCLMVIPGSQNGPVMDHRQGGMFVGAVKPAGLASRAVPLQLRAGGVSLHHTRLLHGSAANTSRQPRRFLLFEYCSGDAWPLMGVPDWDAYHARLLRGEEVDEPRMEHVPIRIPLPKSMPQGTIYELQSRFQQR
jgi:phytanoyl-CoA hydroxylase